MVLKRCYKGAEFSQFRAGQDAGAQAAIYTMRDIFANTDVVLLNDAENSFNSINRMVNAIMKFICLIITTYTMNCYPAPSGLFIASEGERYFLVKGQLYVIQQLW